MPYNKTPRQQRDETARRDIWSVKTYSDGRWCHVFMSKSKKEARRRAAEERGNRFNECVVVVHPRQWVVDGYAMYNGDIT